MEYYLVPDLYLTDKRRERVCIYDLDTRNGIVKVVEENKPNRNQFLCVVYSTIVSFCGMAAMTEQFILSKHVSNKSYERVL